MNDLRKRKGLLEKIMLLKINRRDDGDVITFDIFSQSNKTYNIKFTKDCEVPFRIECNCMDFIFRKNPCKHIYWLGCKKIGNVEPELLTFDIVREFSKNYTGETNNVNSRKNETCGICLDNVFYDTEHTVCCSTCKYSIHLFCWNSYLRISKNDLCIMCRSDNVL